MKEPNWEEAPEGAIGFAIARGSWENSIWYKKDENGRLVYTVVGEAVFWRPSYAVPEHVVWRNDQASEPWAGDGLPPVGGHCEYFDGGEWMPCEVVAHRNNAAVVLSDCYAVDFVPRQELRPLRTPEQIALEERNQRVSEIMGIVKGLDLRFLTDSHAPHVAIALYDAGYRKVEGGAQ